MFSNLNVFQTASAMAAHAGERQSVIAQNIANADTPGYRSKDIPDFVNVLRRTSGAMKATRAGHVRPDGPEVRARIDRDADAPADPNRNTVSLEIEMMKSVDVKRQHDRALAIYRSAMNVLRASISRT
jgi:flagellar basal-body rod protein FlgB